MEPCLPQKRISSNAFWYSSLHWRHSDHDGVSNHQPHGCLLNQFIQAQIKENIKAPRQWPLCGEFTGTGEFPAQRASNAENISIWWRHHVTIKWRHKERRCFWNHQHLHCLFSRCSVAHKRKHQSYASLAFMRGIHRLPVDSSHKGPVTRKRFPHPYLAPSANEIGWYFTGGSQGVSNYNLAKFIKYLRLLSVETWYKMQTYFHVS